MEEFLTQKMKIEISNRQKTLKLNSRKIRKLTRHLMERVRRLDRNRDWKEISVVLTDTAGIKPVNRKYLVSREATDVISFRYDPMPGDNGLYGAEIIVNAEQAAEEGKRRRGWDASRELALYLAHGCDHLTGESDSDSAGRARMRRRELRWLKEQDLRGIVGNG